MIRKKSTPELFKESLFDLLSDRPFEEITVTQIAENCGVSQRTFYNHFRDKYHLGAWVYCHVLEEYLAAHPGISLPEWFRISAETVYEQRFFLQKIVRYRGQNMLRVDIHRPYTDLTLQVLTGIAGGQLPPSVEQTVSFFTGGMINFVERALDEPVIPLAEQAAALFLQSLPACLEPYL